MTTEHAVEHRQLWLPFIRLAQFQQVLRLGALIEYPAPIHEAKGDVNQQ